MCSGTCCFRETKKKKKKKKEREREREDERKLDKERKRENLKTFCFLHLNNSMHYKQNSYVLIVSPKG
jgi:hypothetical protein